MCGQILRSLLLNQQKALLCSVADGNVAAFKELFDIYRTGLYAAALKITKSPYAAEEIVQEIFTVLWESRSMLDKVEDPAAYIFTIAYHQSFRYLKKVAADTALYQALLNRAKDTHNETEEWLELKEVRQLIDHAVHALPPQRQLIYRMSRESGLSHRQIAEQLHISPLTVKKQLVLALRNIRSCLTRLAPLLALCFCHFL